MTNKEKIQNFLNVLNEEELEIALGYISKLVFSRCNRELPPKVGWDHIEVDPALAHGRE